MTSAPAAAFPSPSTGGSGGSSPRETATVAVPPRLAVVLAPSATRDLDALPADRHAQVTADVEHYAVNPAADPPHVKRLKGFKPPLYRLRSGDYRVLFRIAAAELHVYRIIDRKILHRTLKRIK